MRCGRNVEDDVPCDTDFYTLLQGERSMDKLLLIDAVLLGLGLAMDAFSVSVANALNEPKMRPAKLVGTALVFGAFQTLMPLIGWYCVHTIAAAFAFFRPFIPWIAMLLLVFLGGKMIYSARRGGGEEEAPAAGLSALLLQGLATSIDALSVGFTIAGLELSRALAEAGIIGLVTFCVCSLGLVLGKRLGSRVSGKAEILGGVILIVIGVQILVKSLL